MNKTFYGYNRNKVSKFKFTSGKHEVYAALDLGTSSCRLLVVGEDHDGEKKEFVEVERFSQMVNLGESLYQTGFLSEEAITRAVEVFYQCAKKMNIYKPTKIRCVATEACRLAKNTAELVERIQREAYLNLEIISHEEEARFAVLGCVKLFPEGPNDILVIDIGGGSIELIFLKNESSEFEIIKSKSFPMGVINLAQQFTNADNKQNYDEIKQFIKNNIQGFLEFIKNNRSSNNFDVISTSGTSTTLLAVAKKLLKYDRNKIDGKYIGIKDLLKSINYIKCLSFEEKIDNNLIGLSRANLVVPGCAIMDVIFEELTLSKIMVADRGVRDGIILEMINQKHGA